MLAALLPICSLLLVAGEETIPSVTWGNGCPGSCSCHLGHFADLPINQWMQKEHVKVPQESTTVTNEAYYEDDGNDHTALFMHKGELLKIAMCIFQSSSDPQKLLKKLPKDTQALTLLQSRGSEEITLESEHMKHFQQLIHLDIQGYCPEVWKEESHDHQTEHNFMVSNDMLKPIATIQYLSLQHIKLLGSSIQSNEIDHEGHSPPQLDPNENEIVIDLQREAESKIRRRLKNVASNLVFLKPTGAEQELVSYQVYKEQQERARLSIFAKLSNLILLRVVDCGLHEVYWEMFEGLRKLEHLSLEKNQLLFLPEFAFYGAPNLKALSLAHNKILNIHSTGLAGLLELQKLDLSYNNFSHLSEFSLPPFPKLTEAYFWHNPIEAVFASTFEIMNATKVLYLGGNNSSLTLHPNSFQGLNQLETLVLYNVGIEVLERELLRGMPQLKYLKMSGTITSISFDAFLDAPLLETLDIQHCYIKSVSMDAFYGLYRLVVLDLSNNLLESLPPGVFDQQFSLKELYLQNNSLTELPDGFFTNISAKMVRLEGNMWHCSCNMKGWLATMTNRVKEVKMERSMCEHDKNVVCSPPLQGISYVYEKKVAPRCGTPTEYKGWSVYQVLHKELRCSKPQFKKINRREYLKRKYERSNIPNIKLSNSNSSDTNRLKFLGNRNNKNNSNNVDDIKILNISSLTSFGKHNRTFNVQEKINLPTTISARTNVTTEIQTELNTNSTNSLTDNTEQEAIDNNLPLIPKTQNHNVHRQIKIKIQQSQGNSLPNIQQNSQLGVNIKRKSERGPSEISNSIQLPQQSAQNAKFLRKLWKTELQRKNQENIKNLTRA